MSSTFISEVIDRAVQVAIEVNKEFTPEYENSSSEIYKEFVDDFILMVRIVD